MKTVLLTVLAVIAGLALGAALSRLIGIVGLLLFEQTVEVRYLPLVLAFVFASAELLVDMPMVRRSR